MVPARRHQRQIAQGARRHDLGRMGRRARRPRPGLRPAVALLAGAGRPHDRPDRQCGRRDPPQSGFAPADRHRLESGRRRQDGAAAVPLPVPVLRRRRQAVLPALPALGRHLSRRAVQHRLLRAADHDDGAGDRARSPASSSTRSATRTSISTTSSRRACSCRARRARCRRMRLNPAVKDHLRLPLRGLRARRLRAAPAHQGRGRGVSARGRRARTRDRPARRRRRQRRDRPRQCAAVAARVRSQALQGADHGQAGADGPQDLSLDRQAAAGPHQHRGQPRPAFAAPACWSRRASTRRWRRRAATR